MKRIERGVLVRVRSADGRLLERRAVTEVIEGHEFPVVWVCRVEEWVAAERDGREPEGVPWPAEDVEVAA